ncbi:hypothetical protein GNIT_1050 [Glaciecola nitratireducens FR1064]|uniref:Uncharacterized protein n=1 Tax=Glaciecola nitratireducens (strain JCM 12485 / KCTC 12276 / FR1064) TaxID=1085623 RepID=G4QK60_GLANF|nr:hypothetical protein GNIT_1050 [Glaciecola nitratireducens FR1064]
MITGNKCKLIAMCPTCIEKSLDYLIQKRVVNGKTMAVF